MLLVSVVWWWYWSKNMISYLTGARSCKTSKSVTNRSIISILSESSFVPRFITRVKLVPTFRLKSSLKTNLEADIVCYTVSAGFNSFNTWTNYSLSGQFPRIIKTLSWLLTFQTQNEDDSTCSCNPLSYLCLTHFY